MQEVSNARGQLMELHTLSGLDVSLGCVVRHRNADDHVQGKELVVESALGLHVHLQQPSQTVSSGCHAQQTSGDMFWRVLAAAVK